MKRIWSVISVLLIMTSCQEESTFTGDGFLRVLDDRDIDIAYTPVGITEMSEGSLMLLTQQRQTGKTFPQATIIMLDEKGDFLSSSSLDSELGEPIGDLMQIGVNNYFFAMRSADYQCFLVTVDDIGTIISNIAVAGLTFPLAASAINGQLLLQTYDAENFNTVLG